MVSSLFLTEPIFTTETPEDFKSLNENGFFGNRKNKDWVKLILPSGHQVSQNVLKK